MLEREQVVSKLHKVTACLEQALSGISFEKLDISDEVKEQVEIHLLNFIIVFFLGRGLLKIPARIAFVYLFFPEWWYCLYLNKMVAKNSILLLGHETLT